jgi:hypothetical protein
MLFNSLTCQLGDSKLFQDIAWKKCVRRIFKLPPRTRSKFVHCLFDKPAPRIELLCRFANFLTHCFSSTNLLLRTCTRLLHCGFSAVDKNFKEMLSFCKINYLIFSSHVECGISITQLVHKTWAATTNPDDRTSALTIIELCKLRNGDLESPLTYVECT